MSSQYVRWPTRSAGHELVRVRVRVRVYVCVYVFSFFVSIPQRIRARVRIRVCGATESRVISKNVLTFERRFRLGIVRGLVHVQIRDCSVGGQYET